MEYLMTYGWAILIIAVVLGALFAIGVFSGTSFLGTASCVATSGYLCQNPILLPATSNAVLVTLTVVMGQNTGTNVYNAFFSIAPQGSGVNSYSFPTTVVSSNGVASTNGAGATTNFVPSSANNIGTLVSGGTSTYSFNLPITGSPWLASNALGGTLSGSIWLNYSNTAATSPATTAVKIGTIIVKVT